MTPVLNHLTTGFTSVEGKPQQARRSLDGRWVGPLKKAVFIVIPQLEAYCESGRFPESGRDRTLYKG